MEQKNTSVFYNALIWGVIIGLLSIIYSVILYVMNQATNNTLGMLGIIILVAGLVIALLNYRNSVLGGYISFGTAFGFCVLVAVFATLISSIYGYIQLTVIDPGLQDKVFETAMEKAMEKGATEDQLNDLEGITRRLMSPGFMMIIGFVQIILASTVLSLIIAAIFKKNGPEELIDLDKVNQ